MTDRPIPNRCRLVLIAPLAGEPAALAARLREALSGGDVATLIVPAVEGEAAFQAHAEALVAVAQAAGVATVIAQDTRVAGRVGADGIHLESGAEALREAVEKARGRSIVGAGGATTRDEALDLGEADPDYVFFGKFGYDNKPEPHRRNLSLGEWWAEMIQIPCVVLGGSDVASVEAVAATGADFVALSSAVFGDGVDAAAAVAEANAVLDRTAPRLSGSS